MTPHVPTSMMTRRSMLASCAHGLGGVALASLLSAERRHERRAEPHFAPRARNVIAIHLVGAPSHLDLFDRKPELQRRSGQPCPAAFFEGKRLAFIRERPEFLGTPVGTPFAFRRCGNSGLELSNLLPHLQTCADDLTLIRTLQTDEFNHAPAQMFLQTGFARFGRPSLGAWTSYGLGTANCDLPAFVVMVTGEYPGAGNSAFGSGFLPSDHQGVELRSEGDPVLFLSDPRGMTRTDRGDMIRDLNALNRLRLADDGDPEIAARIRQYELAYRMQTAVPELMDLRQEPARVHELYGTRPGKKSFANHCLLARRLVERGVRFVQLFDQGWDHHGSLFTGLPRKCNQVDRPIAALLKDLKARGLLDETLVIWTSEFGRTPMGQTDNGQGKRHKVGRDHHQTYAIWLAGGGVKRGHVHGTTDDLGYAPAEDPVHIHDLNATILHLLGLDHQRLIHRFEGREHRLTDVAGNVVHGVIA